MKSVDVGGSGGGLTYQHLPLSQVLQLGRPLTPAMLRYVARRHDVRVRIGDVRLHDGKSDGDGDGDGEVACALTMMSQRPSSTAAAVRMTSGFRGVGKS